MARKKLQAPTGSETDSRLPICSVCNKNLANSHDPDMGSGGAWPVGARVYHCENPTGAFPQMKTAHHTRLAPYSDCWRCRRPLGCPRCLGPDTDAIWCWACGVWQSSRALGRNGVHRGIRLENHPIEWVLAFRESAASGEFFDRNDPLAAYGEEKIESAMRRDDGNGSIIDPDCDGNLRIITQLWDSFRRRQIEALGRWDSLPQRRDRQGEML